MYSDNDIIIAVKRGDITISDFDDTPTSEGGPLGANSYDLRVDGKFLLEIVWADDGPWYVIQNSVADGERINVPVGGTLLALTKERIGTFSNIVGTMKAKSSIGKSSLTVCKCAGLGDVGYDNPWTVELSAFTRIGQPWVIAGAKIAQMKFEETKSPPRSPYNGQYRIEDWPQCMVPKEWRHNRIIADIADVPGLKTSYRGGKITLG